VKIYDAMTAQFDENTEQLLKFLNLLSRRGAELPHLVDGQHDLELRMTLVACSRKFKKLSIKIEDEVNVFSVRYAIFEAWMRAH
ncbi:MAG: hypothetical protein Q9180_008834, partial [Flavoplaca navasiana]